MPLVLAILGAEAEAEPRARPRAVRASPACRRRGSRPSRAHRARTAGARARCGRSPASPASPSTSPARSSMSIGLSWPRREMLRAASTGRRAPACGAACGRGRVRTAPARARPWRRPAPCASSLRAGVFADEPAVAQHGDAVADLVHLVEEMRDEQDRHALVAQAPHQREQRLDFVGVEARGRFVEDQHARIGGDGARDGDELLQRRGQSAGELRRRRCRCRGRRAARARAGASRASRCRRRAARDGADSGRRRCSPPPTGSGSR